MKTTPYCEQKLKERPEIQREWCDRVLRVITLEDGETLHNADFDRNFRDRLRRGLEP